MTEQRTVPIEFTRGAMAVLGRHGQPVGAAFLVSIEERLVATCAHVLLQTGWSPAIPETPIQIRYHTVSGPGRFAQTVVGREWFDLDQDIAFLRVQNEIPGPVLGLPLMHAAGTRGHAIYSFGYPEGHSEGLGGEGRVVDINLNRTPPRLQMNSTDMTHGFSGGPVWDEGLQRVIGMVLGGRQGDEMERLKYVTFAAPTEALLAVCDLLTVHRPAPKAKRITTAGSTEVRGVQYNIGKATGGDVAIGWGASATVHGDINFYINPPPRLDLNLVGIKNFLITYLGTETQRVPFGGRDEELSWLEQWLAKSEKPFLLLAAPAGSGKSALLARWAQRLSEPDRSKKVATIFVPISIRFNTNLPELIFPCIAVQLARLMGEDIPSEYLNMAPGFWRNLVGRYLHRPLPDGRQLLLIVDGLDEAGWSIGPDMFPLELPTTTRIVVSARYLAGDTQGSAAWLDRLGWKRFSLAETHSLEVLSRDGVQEVLAQTEGFLGDSSEPEAVVDKLYDLTNGDPLLVKLYVDWLQEDWEKESVPRRLIELDQIKPDYVGYFRHWWQEQEKLWAQQGQTDPLERKLVFDLLYILYTALGPLTLADLETLLPSWNKHAIRQALKPLRRFIIGDGEEVGFSFSHTRLGDYFRKEFLDDRGVREWQTRFVSWGQQVIAQLKAETNPRFPTVSRYLLRYHSQHLSNAEPPVETYLSLLSWEWKQSWYHYTHTYDGFLRDVDIVIKQLTAEGRRAAELENSAPNIGDEVFCVLCFASINSMAQNLPLALLVSLHQYAGWTDEQVLAYAQQKPDPFFRSRALRSLAQYFDESKQQDLYMEELRATLNIDDEISKWVSLEALAPCVPELVYEAAQNIRSERERANVLAEAYWVKILVALAPHLPQKVYEAAQTIEAEAYRTDILVALAPRLPHEVFGMAQTIKGEWSRGKVLMALAPYLAERVCEAAQAIETEGYRAMILVSLARHLPQQVFDEAQSIRDEGQRARVLFAVAPKLPNQVYEVARIVRTKWARAKLFSTVAPYLMGEERDNALNQALRITQAITNESSRAHLFTLLAPQLPQPRQSEVYLYALQAIQSIKPKGHRVSHLLDLANSFSQSMTEEILQSVLQEALTIYDEAKRVKVLSALAPRAPVQVLEAVEKMNGRMSKSWVLATLTPHLPSPEREEALNQALQAGQAIGDWESRAKLLMALAHQLPDPHRDSAKSHALQAAKAIVSEESRARTLCALARDLEQPQRENVLNQAVEAALMISEYKNDRLWILIDLATQLPQKQRMELLNREYQAIKDVGYEPRRAGLLCSLAPYLPEQVYASAQKFRDKVEQGRVLSALAPHLPDSQGGEALKRALQASRESSNHGSMVWLLSSLAPHYPETVFSASRRFVGSWEGTQILCTLAPHIPEKVFEMGRIVTDSRNQASIFYSLARYLPRPVFNVAQDMVDEQYRAWILTALVIDLPEEVFKASHTLNNDKYRVQVLGRLASGYLPTLSRKELFALWASCLPYFKRISRSNLFSSTFR